MSTALFDGCDDDALKTLKEALGPRYEVLEHYGFDACYEHTYHTIYRTYGDRLIYASCGGCSCGGSGTWSYEESIEAVKKDIPEYMLRDRDQSEEGVFEADKN